MPEFLRAELQAPSAPLIVLGRLVASMLLGGVVAWIYQRTRPESETSSSLAITLVLLSILIAMVTQVIGDNVARAFSLVGALSIVRFRTVVRDTVDTAFVIFAVAVGMAVGADHPSVALSGIGVVGVAAWVMTRRQAAAESQVTYLLQVRVGLGHDVETLLAPALSAHARSRRLVSMSTAKQGMAIEATYRTELQKEQSAGELVKALNRIEGVQSVSINRETTEDR
jgi:cytochrome bd-type quinol oxidase subunit 1